MPFSDSNKKIENGKVKPLVYSCSGCSSAAQMANYIAIKLDRQKIAEMSCIAGVGGSVRSLVKVAKSGRPIVAIDGCPLACVKACLKMHNVNPDDHIILTDLGVKKMNGLDFDIKEAKNLLKKIVNDNITV
ncbi:MAG: putative zinc-binding protein [Fulvivirga sp.]|uniref:putative zinc-binding protein n=1 Tax=Fulvivirga sp. TaxID=1931237 RepID=UPI0032EF7D97